MKSKMGKIIAVIVVIGIVVGAKTLLHKRKEQIQNTPLPQNSYMNVLLYDPKEGSLEEKNSFLAQIEAKKAIKLSTKIPGYIKKVYVDEAQEVKKGDKLVLIDETEILSSIASLRATLTMQKADVAVATKTYQRNKKLYEAGGLALEKLELSKVALQAKQAQVEATKQKIIQLNNQRKYLLIKAPFDGIIDTIFLHKGDLALSAKPILSMNNQQQKLLFSYANEAIKVGDSVYHKTKEIGKVKSIYATSKNALTTAEVELFETLDKPIGSQVHITVAMQKANGCVVPNDTLVHKSDGVYVMMYQNKEFTPKKVDVILENKDKVILKECPSAKIARGSETKLSQLTAYKNIIVIGQ